jgi:hypothetical protein
VASDQQAGRGLEACNAQGPALPQVADAIGQQQAIGMEKCHRATSHSAEEALI